MDNFGEGWWCVERLEAASFSRARGSSCGVLLLKRLEDVTGTEGDIGKVRNDWTRIVKGHGNPKSKWQSLVPYCECQKKSLALGLEGRSAEGMNQHRA